MMNDIRDRLMRCFSTTFPNLTEEEVQLANPTTVSEWDSLATITLVALIEEEFDIPIEPEGIEHLVSFESSLDYMTKRLGVLTN